jgi:phenylacetate-CoA ligase
VGEDGRPVPAGQPGYIVGTSLHNTAMPMIRYRTSDLSAFILDPCPCGRPFRRLRNVTTKAEDFVVTPDGRLISPSILTHPFKPLHGIAESQIIQDRPDRILVKLVPTTTLPEQEVTRLIAALRERIGPDMQVDVEQVSAIPRERSGKFRWVVSTVDHAYRLTWDQQRP